MTLEKKQITCIKCGETKSSDEFYYHRTRKQYMKTCKKCNTKVCVDYQKSKRVVNDMKWIMQARAGHIRRDCKFKNGRECASDLKDLLRKQWELQKGICYYTGIPMVLSNEYKSNPYVMTVDRIDSTKGYIKGNIALCCSLVNKMKQNMSVDELKIMCQTILTHLNLSDT